MVSKTPLTCSDLTGPSPVYLGNFGVRLARELASEFGLASWDQVSVAKDGGGDVTEVMLNSLPPERAAAKRQAIAQRIARESQ